MMTPFNPDYGLIIVRALVCGPNGEVAVRLAMDTGATRTTIGHVPLINLGYDPAGVSDRVQVTMGGGVEFSPLLSVTRVDALGATAESLSVIVHTLPPSASVDGVLGLDFFRGRRLTIDFIEGLIDLT